jgi:hypothetical protein
MPPCSVKLTHLYQLSFVPSISIVHLFCFTHQFHTSWSNLRCFLSQLLICSKYSLSGSWHNKYCQTPTPGEIWELTLLLRGKKNKKRNDPPLNSPRRDCAWVLKFCMWPSVIKRIRLHPKQNLSHQVIFF